MEQSEILDTSFPKLNDWTLERVRQEMSCPNIVLERKYDGTAAILDCFPEESTIIWGRGILKDETRQVYTTNFPEIAEFADIQVEGRVRILGELVVFKEDPHQETFSHIQKRTTRKKEIEAYAKEYPSTFMAFDIAIGEQEGKCISTEGLSYQMRKRILARWIDNLGPQDYIQLVPSYSDIVNKRALLKELDERGFEGVVIKDRNCKWGEKQYKYKPTVTEDVIWYGDYKEGTGKNEGKVGSMVCYQYLNGKLEEVAKVGGLTDELREEITELTQERQVSEDNPKIIEVKAMALLESGKMRSPRFVRFRDDKGPEQCTREI